MSEPGTRRCIERIGTARATREHGDARAGQHRHARLPGGGLVGETLRRDAVERCRVVEHVRAIRQSVLRRGDHEVPALDRRPGPAQVDQARAAAGLVADPARDRLVAAPGGDHQVGPRRSERGRTLLDDTRERREHRQIDELLVAGVDETLDLERPAERFAEGEDLGVVAGAMPHQQPRARCAPRHRCGRRRRLAVTAQRRSSFVHAGRHHTRSQARIFASCSFREPIVMKGELDSIAGVRARQGIVEAFAQP